MKDMLLEQANEDSQKELEDWFYEKHGRWPRKRDLARAVDNFELEQAWQLAMSKDD